jgi:hypothetical protein
MEKMKADLYGNIHKRLRSMLARFSFDVGVADWDVAASVARLRTEWDDLRTLLHAHHEYEDASLHPLLARATQGRHRSFAGDHQGQKIALDDLDRLLRRLAHDRMSAAEREELGLEAYHRMSLFCAGYLRHLEREEAESERALESLARSGQPESLWGAITAGMSTEERLQMIAFMFPALTLSEYLQLVAPLETIATPQVANVLAERARQESSGANWTRLKTMLGM